MYAIEVEENNEGRELADRYLGYGYYDSTTDEDCICFVAKYNGKVVGWAAVYLSKSVPVLQSMVVDESFRGAGISDLLTQKRIDLLKENRYKFVRCYAWTRPDGKCNAERMLQRNKFYCVNIISDYYCNATNCPYCGNGNKCKCSAKVFCRSI